MEPHPVHPVHPVLEDEDEDEEPPRILLYHGEPHGRAQGSGVRPRCPLAWGHSHTLGGGGRGSRQPRGRWLAPPTACGLAPLAGLGDPGCVSHGQTPCHRAARTGSEQGTPTPRVCLVHGQDTGPRPRRAPAGMRRCGPVWVALESVTGAAEGAGAWGPAPQPPGGSTPSPPPPRLVRFLLPRARRPLAVPLWRSGRPGSRLPRGGPFSAAGGCVGRWTWL